MKSFRPLAQGLVVLLLYYLALTFMFKPETVSLDGQRIDKDYEIRFAVKENWLWVFLFLLQGLIL